MEKILVIIPTYNEKENVRAITRSVCSAVPECHILFVDDNSPDGTADIIKALEEENPGVHLLSRGGKSGLGRAYIAGFKWALERDFEYIFEMDADFSHNPEELPAFVEAARDADLVLGSRYVNGIRIINWPLRRLFLSKWASIYVQLVTRMPFTDPTGGYKCYRRKVLEKINLDRITSNGYSFQIEMTHCAWKLGFKIVEIPIVFEERRSGTSKMNSSIIVEAFLMVLKLPFRSSGKLARPQPGKGAENGQSDSQGAA